MLMRRSRTPNAMERGAVLIITSLLLVVLLGFAALAVDAGNAWSTRRQAQNAADLAALAAVQAIPYTLEAEVGPATSAKGSEFVEANAPEATATVEDPTGDPIPCLPRLDPTASRPCYTNVAVGVETGSDNAFAQVIGAGDSLEVPGDAEAHIEITEPALPLFPLAVEDIGGRAFRCYVTNAPLPGVVDCVTPLSLTLPIPLDLVLETVLLLLPPPLNGLSLGLLGGSTATDVHIIALRRSDLGCGGIETNRLQTTDHNFKLGADHLVDTDASSGSRHELGACTEGHALTMPNATQAPLSFTGPLGDALLNGTIRDLTGDPLWNKVDGAGLCSRTNVFNRVTDLVEGVVDDLILLIPGLGPVIDEILDDVVLLVKTLAMAGCLETGEPVFSFNGDEPQLGWALEITGGNQYVGSTPVWIHSLLDFGIVSNDPSIPTGFTLFVLPENRLPEHLREPGPAGFDNLTFKLVD